MESDIKLRDGVVDVVGDALKMDVGFQGGMIELCGSNLKTSVSQLQMYYYGGHLTAIDGNVELGSSDSGTFKGFEQRNDGTVQIAGDKLKVTVGSAEIGNYSNGKFKGITLSSGAVSLFDCYLISHNRDVPSDGKQRVALCHSPDDQLVINLDGHFRGGVKLDGPVQFNGDLTVQTELQMKQGSKLLLSMPDLIIQLPGGQKKKIFGKCIDVLETIQHLQAQCAQLQDRIAALEAR